jgi:uncharacterized membrane protein
MTMSTVEKTIDVRVPVRTAYNQWTQFEDFPKFMEGIREVKQLDDRKLHWRANIGGKNKEWDAVITEQIPDARIAWKSIEGSSNAGVVTFHRVSDDRTRVMLQMAYDPQGVTENLADSAGLTGYTIESSLQSFKKFVEERGEETGAWRGKIARENK